MGSWNFYESIKLLFYPFAKGRLWFYQTCTEFGYYQSSDSKQQAFGNMFPIKYVMKIIETKVNIDIIFHKIIVSNYSIDIGSSNVLTYSEKNFHHHI